MAKRTGTYKYRKARKLHTMMLLDEVYQLVREKHLAARVPMMTLVNETLRQAIPKVRAERHAVFFD